ncbi:hypothetical protein ACWEVY_28570 [Streptomyces longwoodensis]
MANITVSMIHGEFSQDEMRLIRFALSECLNDWDIHGDDDRRTAEELLDDLGGRPV